MLLLILLLLIGTFISIFHATQHSFHQAEQNCDLFLSSEKNTPIDAPLRIITPCYRVFSLQGEPSYLFISQPAFSPFLSRAPPRS